MRAEGGGRRAEGGGRKSSRFFCLLPSVLLHLPRLLSPTARCASPPCCSCSRSAGGIFVASSIDTRERPAEQPTAVRWSRTAAEHDALFEQTYRLAGAHVRQVADTLSGDWAVVLDADETLLDNSLYQRERAAARLGYTSDSWNAWVRRRAAPALPGAVAFTRLVGALGGRVVVVTNRDEAVCADTRANLTASRHRRRRRPVPDDGGRQEPALRGGTGQASGTGLPPLRVAMCRRRQHPGLPRSWADGVARRRGAVWRPLLGRPEPDVRLVEPQPGPHRGAVEDWLDVWRAATLAPDRQTLQTSNLIQTLRLYGTMSNVSGSGPLRPASPWSRFESAAMSFADSSKSNRRAFSSMWAGVLERGIDRVAALDVPAEHDLRGRPARGAARPPRRSRCRRRRPAPAATTPRRRCRARWLASRSASLANVG